MAQGTNVMLAGTCATCTTAGRSLPTSFRRKPRLTAFERGLRDGQSLHPRPSAAQGSTRASGPSLRPWTGTGHRERSLSRGEIPKCPGGWSSTPQPVSSTPGQDVWGGQLPSPLATANPGVALPLKGLALEGHGDPQNRTSLCREMTPACPS